MSSTTHHFFLPRPGEGRNNVGLDLTQNIVELVGCFKAQECEWHGFNHCLIILNMDKNMKHLLNENPALRSL